MSPRFYFSICILAAFAALITWLPGAMTPIGVVAFGFLAFALVFIGMMCVLPSAVAHSHEKPAKRLAEPTAPVQPGQTAHMPGIATFKSA